MAEYLYMLFIWIGYASIHLTLTLKDNIILKTASFISVMQIETDLYMLPGLL